MSSRLYKRGLFLPGCGYEIVQPVLPSLHPNTGGESGIRTHVRVSPKHAFQACAFSHSAISPALFTLAADCVLGKKEATAVGQKHRTKLLISILWGRDGGRNSQSVISAPHSLQITISAALRQSCELTADG